MPLPKADKLQIDPKPGEDDLSSWRQLGLIVQGRIWHCALRPIGIRRLDFNFMGKIAGFQVNHLGLLVTGVKAHCN